MIDMSQMKWNIHISLLLLFKLAFCREYLYGIQMKVA